MSKENSENGDKLSPEVEFKNKWGLSLDEVYKVGVKFCKGRFKFKSIIPIKYNKKNINKKIK